jgi:hypothetical protein
MTKVEIMWIVWGILVSFGMQVLYDGIGELPNLSQKFYGGFIMEVVLAIFFIYVFGNSMEKH